MNKISFLKTILFAAVVVLFSSCDNDPNGIGSNIIGDNNFDTVGEPFQITAYNQKLGPVQTNNLAVNPLGIYNNSAFGTTTANFATQIQWLSTEVIPTIDLSLDPQIASVVLTVPYFSTITATTDGVGTYELDSIYGGTKIKLSVYELTKFIRSYDPLTQLTQVYNSDENSAFEPVTGTLLNNSTLPAQNTEFVFSNAEIVETTTVEGVVTTTRSAPAMKLDLDKVYFQSKLFSSLGTGNLSTNDQLINYFRGLFFKVENSGTNAPGMAMVNFQGGLITVKYKQDLSTTDHTVANRVEKSLVFSLTGNTVSLQEQSNLNADYSAAINAPNPTDGDSSLFLKGAEGSMTVISLFGPGELEGLRASNRIINDATLTVNIDNARLGSATQPNRIYLYDLNNKKPLLDYSYDGTTSSNAKNNKYIHNGIIDKTNNRYKIKLTNHIRNLVLNDTVTNVKLGLVVTESINDIVNVKIKNPISLGTKTIKTAPRAAVENPLGTILFGSNAAVPEDKRMSFKIFYTQPN